MLSDEEDDDYEDYDDYEEGDEEEDDEFDFEDEGEDSGGGGGGQGRFCAGDDAGGDYLDEKPLETVLYNDMGNGSKPGKSIVKKVMRNHIKSGNEREGGISYSPLTNISVNYRHFAALQCVALKAHFYSKVRRSFFSLENVFSLRCTSISSGDIWKMRLPSLLPLGLAKISTIYCFVESLEVVAALERLPVPR